MKLPSFSLKSKRAKIWAAVLGVAIVLAAVLASGFYLGNQRWQALDERVNQDTGELRSVYQSIVAAKTRDTRLAGLDKLATMAQIECQAEWWYDWQASTFEDVKRIQTGCQAQKDHAAAVSTSAQALRSYLEEEQKVIMVISSLKIDKKDKKWAAQAPKQAKAAVESLQRLALSGAAEPVHKAALKAAQKIDKTWQDTQAADKKQDKDAYLEAADKLAQAYAEVSGLADVSDKQITPLVSDFVAKNK